MYDYFRSLLLNLYEFNILMVKLYKIILYLMLLISPLKNYNIMDKYFSFLNIIYHHFSNYIEVIT